MEACAICGHPVPDGASALKAVPLHGGKCWETWRVIRAGDAAAHVDPTVPDVSDLGRELAAKTATAKPRRKKKGTT